MSQSPLASASRLRAHAERFVLRDVVAEVYAVAAPRAAARGLGLTVQVHRDVPDELMGDGPQFKELLDARLMSSLAMLEKGGIAVQITCAEAHLEPEVAWADISLVVHIRGSLPETVLRIPVEPGVFDGPDEDVSETDPVQLRTADLRARVLVIDGDAEAGRQTARVLASLGHVVRLVGDVTAGRRLLVSETFELVLVDLELQSLGFFARLLCEPDAPPVLGLRRPDAEVYMHAGIDGWLHKPPNAAILADMIERQLITPIADVA